MTWHKWPEERPEKEEVYLVWLKNGSAMVSYYLLSRGKFAFETTTHWAEIEPPEDAVKIKETR